MKAKILKEKYLKFFKEKGHTIIPSASLIPENDPSVLFTTAGMHPLVPYLLGEKHPGGKRLADVQKCIRTGDIEEVGDAWHLTFFEMLGNWSLGDYFKKEAIEWSWEFLSSKKWLGLKPEKIFISVFAGDKDAPRDEESAKIWQKVGIPKERIFYYGKKENWWGPAGETGPCGPDTEMYYDTGKKPCGPKCEPKCNCGKYSEIWNDVFMQYNKRVDGKYEPLKQKNVDTGMGVERTAAVLQGKDNVYETEQFKPIIKKIEELSNKKYGQDPKSDKLFRVIADHLRAATFILGDEKGISPSNLDQGYVLRRLIRKSIRHGKTLNIDKVFTFKIAEIVIENYSREHPELEKNKDFILEQLVQEEEKFQKPLKWVEKYRQDLEAAVKHNEIKKIKGVPILSAPGVASGQYLYENYQTHGVPPDLCQEIIKEMGLKFDQKEFNQAFAKHQELSRLGAEKKFKGGLVDHSEQATKFHTATHLLLAALRQVLGNHVFQKGSNITPERLRFDFSHPEKLTKEQIKEVEDIVNQKIKENIKVEVKEMSVDEAKKQGAIGVFEDKYGDKVKVYSLSDFSKEICGGPHVKNTGELGKFKIKKEEASSAGVRRIKAVLN